MPLSKTKRESKEHLYFTLGGSKKLYLGTPENPKSQNLRQALAYLSGKIEKYEEEYSTLECLLRSRDSNEKFRTNYRLIVFDLDGVIYDKPWRDSVSEKVAVSSWDVLFHELGIYPMHEKLKSRFESGEFRSYMEWTGAACEALKLAGLNRDTFTRIIDQRPLMPGAEQVLRTLHASDSIIGVVTGSFEALALRLKKTIVPLYHAAHCAFTFTSEGALRSWKLEETDYEDKKTFVLKLANQLKIPKEQRAYIGDDVNDISAFREVGLSIAFNAEKAAVRREADVVIDSRNLKSILPHLQSESQRLEPDSMHAKSGTAPQGMSPGSVTHLKT